MGDRTQESGLAEKLPEPSMKKESVGINTGSAVVTRKPNVDREAFSKTAVYYEGVGAVPRGGRKPCG